MFTELFESGLVPIPIKPNSKAPTAEALGFNNWAHDGIPVEMIEKFEAKCPVEKGFGVGIVCGKASGICVVDIDSDDQEILHACPPSPVRRRGKKGEARFFKFNPEISNHNFFKTDENGKRADGIDILCDRKYIIIPPSIHPDTGKPYVWLTPDVIGEFDVDDLPELLPEQVDKMGAILGTNSPSLGSESVDLSGTYQSPDGKRCPHGSYNRIKALACGLINKESQIEQAVETLLDYDEKHHLGVGYFNDTRMGSDFGADPYSNAVRLYANILKTTNQQRLRQGFSVQIPNRVRAIDLSEIEALSSKRSKKSFKQYPQPRGIMKKFMEYCELMGKGRQDALGLGGAIALMAGLCSNRFRSTVRGLPVWPNMYVLNIGYSGFGKDAAQRLISDLLFNSGLKGSANYRSGTSMIQNLPKQQERIDVIDECSWLLNAMHSDNSYQAEMVEILSHLFSRSSGQFDGVSSAKDGDQYGAAFNPCVNILGSTTPQGFNESVNSAMAAKGLMPRFIGFFQKEIGGYKGQTDIAKANKIKAELQTWVSALLSVEKPHHPDHNPSVNFAAKIQDEDNKDLTMGHWYDPHEIDFTKEAHDIWMDYERLNHEKAAKDPDEFESAFFGRFAELASKLALLDRVSQLDPTKFELPLVIQGKVFIEVDNIEWAIGLIERCWENMSPMYEFATSQNQFGKDIQIFEKTLDDLGGLASRQDLMNKLKWTAKKFDSIVDARIEAGKLELVLEKTKAKPKRLYKFL